MRVEQRMPPILLPAMAEDVWHDGVIILGLRGVYLTTESSDLVNFAHVLGLGYWGATEQKTRLRI